MKRPATDHLASLLAAVLRTPTTVEGLSPSAWSVLIGQARGAELLGQLRARLDEAALLEAAPEPARRHLDLAWSLSLRHREAVLWELSHIRKALAAFDQPVVLLKGAAYCLSAQPAAEGRVFNDVDIMVPKAVIAQVEDALIDAGWIAQIVNDYDQRYYRQWMHEIPPLEHKSRGTVLDVHHTIVPPTSGIVPDPQSLLRQAVAVQNETLPGFYVLAPEDMVLHSAAHLFFNEFHKGLRDLYDLHRLLTGFGGDSGFWSRLVRRGDELGLSDPLADALHYCHRVFATTVPPAVLDALRERASRSDALGLRSWMLDHLFAPDHPSCTTPAVRLARWMGFVRSHWLRMPVSLLAVHLVAKFVRRKPA